MTAILDSLEYISIYYSSIGYLKKKQNVKPFPSSNLLSNIPREIHKNFPPPENQALVLYMGFQKFLKECSSTANSKPDKSSSNIRKFFACVAKSGKRSLVLWLFKFPCLSSWKATLHLSTTIRQLTTTSFSKFSIVIESTQQRDCWLKFKYVTFVYPSRKNTRTTPFHRFQW